MTRTPLVQIAIVLASVLAAAGCAGTQPPRRVPVARAPEPVPGVPDIPEPEMPGNPPPTTTPMPTGPAPVAPRTADPDAPRNYETIRIKVAGMTCPIRCVREVKEQLEAVTGVLHVTIDSDRREAIVDIAAGTNPDDVLAGLRSPYAGRLL